MPFTILSAVLAVREMHRARPRRLFGVRRRRRRRRRPRRPGPHRHRGPGRAHLAPAAPVRPRAAAGWAVSMFAPLVVAMLPLDWLVSSSLREVTGVDSGDDRNELVDADRRQHPIRDRPAAVAAQLPERPGPRRGAREADAAGGHDRRLGARHHDARLRRVLRAGPDPRAAPRRQRRPAGRCRVAGGQPVRPPRGDQAVHLPAHDRRRGASPRPGATAGRRASARPAWP